MAIEGDRTADQIRLPAGGSMLTLVQGDLFASDADFFVVPCSTNGSVTPAIAEELARLGVELLTTRMEPGQVVPGRAGRGPSRVLFAAVVPESLITSSRDVVEAARHVMDSLPADSSVAFPLLGSGAGGLDMLVSLQAIIEGVTSSPLGVRQRVFVHVLDPLQFDRLSRAVQRAELAVGTQVPEDEGSAAAAPDSGGEGGAEAPERAERLDEVVPTHADDPAQVDELGRMGFARILAQRIRAVRPSGAAKPAGGDQVGAFLIHLHAPWGAGKTSLLNFLTQELRTASSTRSAAVVIEFNAWRHQRMESPWWWLMSSLYAGAVQQLPFRDRQRLRLSEWWWRLKGGWRGFLAAAGVLAGAVLVWRAWLGPALDDELLTFDTLRGAVITVAAIITPVLTVWGVVRGLGRWLFATSLGGARRYVASTTDPMRLVQDHVGDLTRWIGRDVVMMIDDLDRCRAAYVVELLEGIQTLFRDAPVTYVVAADRDWLADSFVSTYPEYEGTKAQPGRPLGYLFMEKTFQISTGLPQAQTADYWNRLLRSDVPAVVDLQTARAEAKRAASTLTPQQYRELVATNPGGSPAQIQAQRETVALDMVSEHAQAANAHVLEPFRSLLGREANPRTMKRLVNAYGIARGIETLQGLNLDDDGNQGAQTALWTILTLRWPQLGAYLAQCPDDVEAVGAAAPDRVPPDLAGLFTDPAVIAVVRGTGVNASLTADWVRTIALP